jgi:hypothetical protein
VKSDNQDQPVRPVVTVLLVPLGRKEFQGRKGRKEHKELKGRKELPALQR